MIRILLADDQGLFVESLRISLESYVDDIQVVGIARDGREAIELAEKTRPDIILMDVCMPNVDGVEACRQIVQGANTSKIIMLSTYDEDEYVHEALRYGACGYLLKDISPTELIAAIRGISTGLVQIYPKIVRSSLTLLRWHQSQIRGSQTAFEWFDTLTTREKEIFGMIAMGYDNRQIGEKLFLAEQTTQPISAPIYGKIGCERQI